MAVLSCTCVFLPADAVAFVVVGPPLLKVKVKDLSHVYYLRPRYHVKEGASIYLFECSDEPLCELNAVVFP